ncbi:MAG: alpha/beta hydrolase [Candidatus Eremiobacteraeota bacterium]|nr:alpha/beta hydrolase [Candidatus Eremiobacteraeota bacterium]
MADVLANGVHLHVQRLGPPEGVAPTGETIVLIHGLIVDDLSSYYFTLANPLAAAGHDVVLYDLRGHGHSERPPTGYTLRDGIADLDGLLAALDIDRPVHLVGNSYGGAIAMGMALEHPERVADVTMIEGHYATEGFGEEMAETLRLVTVGIQDEKWRNWIEARGRKTMRLARRGVTLIEDTSISDDVLAMVPPTQCALQALRMPLLAIYGGASEVLERGRELERLVAGTRLIVLPDLDHRVLFNTAPYLCEVLLWWYAGHAGEPPAFVPPDVPFEPAPLSRAMLPSA